MKRFYIISSSIFQKIIWLIFRPLLIIFTRIEIEGLDNLKNVDRTNGVIFAPNHSSELDAFILATSLPLFSRFIPIYYVTRGKKFYNENIIRRLFYGGILFSMIGGQPVGEGLNDYNKSLSNHINLLKSGKNVCIFPEGGITKDGQLSKPHGGVSYLAEITQSTLIPVGIYGVYKLSIIDFFLMKRKIVIKFDVPISYSKFKRYIKHSRYKENKYRFFADYLMYRINKLIKL